MMSMHRFTAARPKAIAAIGGVGNTDLTATSGSLSDTVQATTTVVPG
jgi:hypothetical protein